MPSSRPNAIPVVIHLLRQIRPRSILDVGVGFGKWGHLFREYTDINEAERDPARYQPTNWHFRIDGIEGHANYLTEMHRFLYNEIHVGDAAELLPKLPHYDLIFLGDIIEHFDKPRGEQLLRDALEHANKAVVVSTPRFETEQGDLCANDLERHRSLWHARDFKKWPGAQVKVVDGDTLVAVLTRPGQPALSLSPPRRGSRTAELRLRRARAELIRLIPLDERFALVDEEQLRSTLPHPHAIPFPSREGIYWGPPEDSAAAIRELERLRHEGAKRLVFIWSTFWWLDHYRDFARFLEANWKPEARTGTVIVYCSSP
jgi:hypothetical protein